MLSLECEYLESLAESAMIEDELLKEASDDDLDDDVEECGSSCSEEDEDLMDDSETEDELNTFADMD